MSSVANNLRTVTWEFGKNYTPLSVSVGKNARAVGNSNRFPTPQKEHVGNPTAFLHNPTAKGIKPTGSVGNSVNNSVTCFCVTSYGDYMEISGKTVILTHRQANS